MAIFPLIKQIQILHHEPQTLLLELQKESSSRDRGDDKAYPRTSSGTRFICSNTCKCSHKINLNAAYFIC